MTKTNTSSTENVRQMLLDFINRELLDAGSVAVEDSLLTGGVIDSLGLVRLAGFIGEEFGFQVPPEDFVIPNFGTVEAVTAYVVRYREEYTAREQ